MNTDRLKKILSNIGEVKVGIYGDFCIDAYWMLDPRGSEISAETGLQGQAVGKQVYSLGGAANVVANLAALKPEGIHVTGIIGDDLFGRELIRRFGELGVDTSRLVVQEENFDTVVFGKRYLDDEEQPRIDFGFFNQRNAATDAVILEGIEELLQSTDALIFNQQVPDSIQNDAFIDDVNTLFEKYADKIVLLDSRHYGDRIRGVCRKMNELEAARLGDAITRQSGKPFFVTRGERGIRVADADGTHDIPGIELLAEIDPVGAGDTVTSALALCLGAGVKPVEAAEFANIAAAVTVQKRFTTGMASGEEIRALAEDVNYIYQPELAENPGQAVYMDQTEIELCCPSLPPGKAKHVVFDHDGTISTLRQGWEEAMTKVMAESILGGEPESVEETLRDKVQQRVLNYIDRSTGIQTILQMQALVEMVKDFGLVADDEVLDRFGYKKIFNDELMKTVSRRIDQIRQGNHDANDYVVQGVREFLKALRDRGVKLYLTSGTDKEDVIHDATLLGYAGLFEDRIYGSVGDVTKYSKKLVIERIMTENRLQGSELLVFGDGPVELRECRKRDGIAVGIASDETKVHGLNAKKRTRLIRAGAQIIIPDFSQSDQLMEFIF